MKITKYSTLFFSVVVIFLLLGVFLRVRHFKIVDISGKKFIAELVISPEKQKKGLGGRRSLCGACAMLFDFKEKNRLSFWMKDMRFDLDIIWVSNEKIVYIEKNFSHNSKEIVSPKLKADKVIEIGAGLSDKYDIKVGDVIRIY